MTHTKQWKIKEKRSSGHSASHWIWPSSFLAEAFCDNFQKFHKSENKESKIVQNLLDVLEYNEDSLSHRQEKCRHPVGLEPTPLPIPWDDLPTVSYECTFNLETGLWVRDRSRIEILEKSRIISSWSGL